MAELGTKLIFPELSYEIIGCAFAVFNELGWGLAERDYQAAFASEAEKRKMSFEREVYIPLQYQSKKIGRFFVDFIVEHKILLEFKVVSKLGYTHIQQIYPYLKAAGLKVGILIYFTRDGVKYRRFLNPEAVS